MIKYSMQKLLTEMIGTCLFALLFIMGTAAFPLFLGLWIITAFSHRISGAHFNPAVSFAFAIRKSTGGISRKLALWYIVFQVAGAVAAGFLCLWL
jgi:glycerol uptake facilitator-like aquaporin